MISEAFLFLPPSQGGTRGSLLKWKSDHVTPLLKLSSGSPLYPDGSRSPCEDLEDPLIVPARFLSASSQYSSFTLSRPHHCCLNIQGILLLQDLCTCCSLSWTALPLDTCKAGYLISFWSVFKCHFFNENFPGHPIWKGNFLSIPLPLNFLKLFLCFIFLFAPMIISYITQQTYCFIFLPN